MPVAMPTWRNVLLAPDAIPLRCGSTTEMEVDASTGFTIPIPAPATMNPGSSTVQVESGCVWAMSRRPAVMRSSPVPRR